MAPRSHRLGACAVLVACLRPWAEAAVSLRNASVGDRPAPFDAMGCGTVRDPDDRWIFSQGQGQWSSCDQEIRGDGAYMCAENGKVDHTSIVVSLASLDDKSGCFAWLTSDCTFDLKRVAQITFQVDLRDCEGVWAAPLWLCPDPWTEPADLSGEIDLLEMCPRGSVATNFGAAGGPGEHQKKWGSAAGLGGPKKFTMALDQDSGTLSTTVCNLDGSGCFSSAYYENFLNVVNPTKGRDDSYPYHFTADVWNGYGGDAGWSGCGGQNDPNSQCQFVVKQIRVHTVDGSPLFSDGKCAALNGGGAVAAARAAKHANETIIAV